jgi:hypothetical protein
MAGGMSCRTPERALFSTGRAHQWCWPINPRLGEAPLGQEKADEPAEHRTAARSDRALLRNSEMSLHVMDSCRRSSAGSPPANVRRIGRDTADQDLAGSCSKVPRPGVTGPADRSPRSVPSGRRAGQSSRKMLILNSRGSVPTPIVLGG